MIDSGPAAPRPDRTLVKVCGITRLLDAAHALECGADWLGFIVKAGGPREIGPDGMARIVEQLPGLVGVAVLADVGPDEALALGQRAKAVRLQLHRVDASRWPADFPLPCAFVTTVDAEGRPGGPLAPPPHLPHLDTAHRTLTGGTGIAFPWAAARAITTGRAFVLAGGLGPDNVAEAMEAASPAVVDACSRLEVKPGVKDPEGVRLFVDAVRSQDERRRPHA